MKLSSTLERIMLEYPKTQDSDKQLLIYYWRSKGLELTANQLEIFLSISSPESVRRTRQKIQEAGKYRGTKRKFKEKKGDIVTQRIAKAPEPEKLFDDANTQVRQFWR